MGFLSGSDPKIEALEVRVRRLEAIVAQLAAGGDVDTSPPALAGLTAEARAEAHRLKLSGKEIRAIKYVREQTGMGLREAKELVDRL